LNVTLFYSCPTRHRSTRISSSQWWCSFSDHLLLSMCATEWRRCSEVQMLI